MGSYVLVTQFDKNEIFFFCPVPLPNQCDKLHLEFEFEFFKLIMRPIKTG
jgi:hypothetical protein